MGSREELAARICLIEEADAAREGLGALIRAARTESGLTLGVVAQRVGVSVSYLSDIENGKRDGGVDRLVSIAGAIMGGRST